MARKQGGPPPKQNQRPVPARAAVAATPAPVRKLPRPDAPDNAGAGFNPVGWVTALPKFLTEVRAEARKVTWTKWPETWITAAMVFGMVFFTAIFFLIVDTVLGSGMHALLNLVTGKPN